MKKLRGIKNSKNNLFLKGGVLYPWLLNDNTKYKEAIIIYYQKV